MFCMCLLPLMFDSIEYRFISSKSPYRFKLHIFMLELEINLCGILSQSLEGVKY